MESENYTALRVARWLAAGLSLALAVGLVFVVVNVVAASPVEFPKKEISTSAPQELHVCPSGCDYSSIQAAVDAAGEGELIKLAAGTYTGVSARAGVTQLVYISQTLTLQGGYTLTNWTTPYPITQVTTLDAQGQGRVIYITGDPSSGRVISPTVKGLRLVGGDAAGQGGFLSGAGMHVITAAATIEGNQIVGLGNTSGGGLYLQAAPALVHDNQIMGHITSDGGGVSLYHCDGAILSHNTITGNQGFWDGGGVHLEESSATLDGNTISANLASRGGGVYLGKSTAVLIGNTIVHNDAACLIPRFCDFYGGGGGGVFLDGSDATLEANTISGNNAGNEYTRGLGGGLALLQSPATLVRNVISGNVAYLASWGDSLGGGLYLEESPAVLDGNTVITNTAAHGGGLYLDRSAATLANTVVAGNQATAGGGLYLAGAPARLLHTTIAQNHDSGIYVTAYTSQPGVVTPSMTVLTNTIVVSHAVGITVTAGNTATLAATLWRGNDRDWGGSGGILTGTHNVWGDPAFVDPLAWDYHIGPTSSARDAGLPSGVGRDVDGDPRPMGSAYDLGADEFVLGRVLLPVVLKNH